MAHFYVVTLETTFYPDQIMWPNLKGANTMKIATSLLKARHVGVRELKANLSKFLKENTTMVITDHGTPTNVIVAYEDIVELVDILDELMDKATMNSIQEGRNAIAAGSKGVPVSNLFNKMRKNN